MKVVMLLRSDELRLFFPCFVHLPQGTDDKLSFLKGSEDVTPVRIRQTAVTEPQFPKIKLYGAFLKARDNLFRRFGQEGVEWGIATPVGCEMCQKTC